DVLSYTDSPLTNGKTYYYKVTAVNEVGEGPPSNEASATPVSGQTVPSPPRSLSAAAGDARVTLGWLAPSSDGGSPITNYTIYRGTDGARRAAGPPRESGKWDGEPDLVRTGLRRRLGDHWIPALPWDEQQQPVVPRRCGERPFVSGYRTREWTEVLLRRQRDQC